MQEKQARRSRRAHRAHLVVVTSLLNELVHYLLCLLVTFLLQVSDERVQVAGAVIRLHDRLMRLNDTSDTCRHGAAPSEGQARERLKQSRAPSPHPPAAASACQQIQAALSSLPDLLLLPTASSPQLSRQSVCSTQKKSHQTKKVCDAKQILGHGPWVQIQDNNHRLKLT